MLKLDNFNKDLISKKLITQRKEFHLKDYLIKLEKDKLQILKLNLEIDWLSIITKVNVKLEKLENNNTLDVIYEIDQGEIRQKLLK